MNAFLSVCIWGNGPGRPYDNIYQLKEIEYEKDVLRLVFCDGEECDIIRPKNMVLTTSGLKIDYADRIIWKFYFYGKPKSQDTLVTMEYIPMSDSHVRITTKGPMVGERIVMPQGIAFDSFGDIKVECFASLK